MNHNILALLLTAIAGSAHAAADAFSDSIPAKAEGVPARLHRQRHPRRHRLDADRQTGRWRRQCHGESTASAARQLRSISQS